MMYKKHLIEPASYYLRDLGLWSVRGHILHDEGNATISREFDCGRGYQNKRDAELDFIHYAHRIIDAEQ